jgi:hypothetical protein
MLEEEAISEEVSSGKRKAPLNALNGIARPLESLIIPYSPKRRILA